MQTSKAKHDIELWIDIENELKVYSLQSMPEDVEQNFYSLCSGLTDYLKSLEYENINHLSPAYLLISSLKNEKFLILDFNYTATIGYILHQLGANKNFISERILKMHGSIYDQIIFGVEDKAKIRKEHIFLKKSFNINFKSIRFKNLLQTASKISFFGHSLGETDHMYFSDFIFECAVGNTQNKEFHFYFYHQNGYKDLHIQLDTLTQQNLTKFKQNNTFVAFDASTNIQFASK